MSTTILRKRYIPDEIIDISDDKIIYESDELLITEWVPKHARDDIKNGKSYAYVNKGYKISEVYNHQNEFDHYYCDIMDITYNKATNTYLEIDLLVDVVLYPDGRIKVLDLNELADARRESRITEEQMLDSLEKANQLLSIIYDGKFEELLDQGEQL